MERKAILFFLDDVPRERNLTVTIQGNVPALQ